MPGPGAGTFSFVHAADLHLDTPFHGVHAVAPKIAHALREASLDAFDAIVDLAIRRDAAFLLVAGDVYDGAERGLRAQLRFREGLERLSAGGIASFVVHGNHDPVATGWSAISGSWPERATIFGSDAVDVVAVERDGVRLATVQGVSYATNAVSENLSRRFSRPDGDGLAIGLLHCNVDGAATGYANYSPCTLDDLRRTGLDYLALGHIHERRILAGERGRGPWVVYPGNSQARSPRKSEEAAKGAVVVHVVDGAVDNVEFVACDRVRFAEIACSIETVGDLGELEDQLLALAGEQLELSDGRSLIVRARLVGRGAVHRDLVRAGVLGELVQALRDASGEDEPFLWWDEVRDETQPVTDLELLRTRGDFASDLLEIGESLQADRAALDALGAHLVTEAPRALHGVLQTLVADHEVLRALGRRATLLALDEVIEEDE